MSRQNDRSTTKAFAPLLLAALAIFIILKPTPVNACACCGTFKVINVEQGDVLNVRKGPGTGYPIITGIAPGDGCIIKTGKKRGRWVSITHGDIKGWVHSRYLGFIE